MKQTTYLKEQSSLQPGLFLQLLATHLLAAGLALGVMALLSSANSLVGWLKLTLALGVAVLAGVLASLNLQLALQALETRLHQLSLSLSCSPLANLKRYWPLSALLNYALVLNTRLINQAQQQQESSELKDLWRMETTLTVQYRTRAGLANQLHDTFKRQIHDIQLAAATAQTALENNRRHNVEEALANIRDYTKQVLEQVEELIADLKSPPTSEANLLKVIDSEAQKLKKLAGVEVSREVPQNLALSPKLVRGLSRVIELTVANIIRHAQATTVSFKLQPEDKELKLEISDNGRGFDVSATPGNNGLANCRLEVFRLGGELKLVSRPGSGTTLIVRVPLSDPEEVSYRNSSTSFFKNWSQRLSNLYSACYLGVEFSLLLVALVLRIVWQGFTPGVEGLVAGLIILVFVSLGLAFYGYLQARNLTGGLVDQPLANSEAAKAWKKRSRYYSLLLPAVFLSAFIPLVVLRFPGWPGLNQEFRPTFPLFGDSLLVALGLSFIVGLGIVVISGRVYHYTLKYYDQLWQGELLYELAEGWKNHSFQFKLSLYLLGGAGLYLVGNGFSLPPNAWQWLAAYSVLVFSGFVVTELLKRRFLTQHQQKLVALKLNPNPAIENEEDREYEEEEEEEEDSEDKEEIEIEEKRPASRAGE